MVLPVAASIFATTEIGKLVEGFDFSKMDVKDNTKDDYLHVGLAPSYGKLKDGTAMKTMDDELMIMIAATIKDLEAMRPDERSWEAITNSFMQNPLLEPDGSSVVHRNDKLIKHDTNVFKFDGSPDATIVQEVKSWFTKLISDQDVLDSSAINIKVLADIVAQTGATVTSFETVFFKKESHEKNMVDIGVLRFPDTDRPYFQVYRIKLFAWSTSTRIGPVQDDSNGITGEYFSRNFKPRKSVMDKLDAKTKEKAIEEARKKLEF